MLLDFTKRRKGSIAENGRKIGVCPKCGRKGTISRYKNGRGLCVHTAEHQGFCLGARDFCCLPKPDPK
jgi:ribosomal protein L37AE/L43A